MANDTDAEIEITGNAEGFRRAAKEVTAEMDSMVKGMSAGLGNITSLIGGMQGKFLALGSAIGGGKVFKESAEAVKEQTVEALKLSNALGGTAEEANILATAIGNVHLTNDVYLDGTRAVTRALNNNEDSFKKMGIATRDAQGDLLPMQQIISNTASALQEYKAGSDRNVMANQLLGRSYEDVIKLSKINDQTMRDAAQEVEDYNKQLDPELVQQYRDSMENLGDVNEGVALTIGKSVMPVMIQLSNWMSAIGPDACLIIKGAVGGVMAVFWGLKNAVVIAWETINAMVYNIAEPLIGLSSAITLAITGHWKEAGERLGAISHNIVETWKSAFDSISESSADTRDKLWNLFATPEAKTSAPKTGTKTAIDLSGHKPKKTREPAEKSMMQYYESMLAHEKQLASERDALRGMTREEEVAFWQHLIATASVGAKDRLEIDKKMANLSIEINRAKAIQEREDLAETTRFSESYALAEVEQRRNAAQLEFDLGRTTKEQLLVLESQFEQQRYEIQKRAAEERRALAESDPTASVAERARLNNSLLELERQHVTNLAQIQGQQALQANQTWNTVSEHMGGLWDKGVTAMMNGTLRWKNATHAIWMDLGGVFANSLIKPIVMGWVKSLAQMLAQKLGFAAAEKTIDATAATTSVGITSAAAAAKVEANAAVAGSGAAASQSAIPIIGPGLGMAAMAAMVAAVMGLMGSIKSASGGFDIPHGVNPMVQAHAEEMILPKGPSNVIRQLSSMAETGQLGAGGQVGANIHIHSPDSKGVERLLFKNQDALARVMRTMSRNGRL